MNSFVVQRGFLSVKLIQWRISLVVVVWMHRICGRGRTRPASVTEPRCDVLLIVPTRTSSIVCPEVVSNRTVWRSLESNKLLPQKQLISLNMISFWTKIHLTVWFSSLNQTVWILNFNCTVLFFVCLFTWNEFWASDSLTGCISVSCCDYCWLQHQHLHMAALASLSPFIAVWLPFVGEVNTFGAIK